MPLASVTFRGLQILALLTVVGLTTSCGLVRAPFRIAGSLTRATVAASRTLEAGRARIRFGRPTGASGSGAVAALTFRGLREGSGAVVVESVAVGVGGATGRPAPPPPGRIVVAP